MSFHDSDIDAHLIYLANSLQEDPEVRPAIDLIGSAPEFAINTYRRYEEQIGRMALLGAEEIESIGVSQQLMAGESSTKQGSVSKVGANDILSALGESRDLLGSIATESVNPDSPHYQPAIDELVRRMERGHQMSVDGVKPSDEDTRTHEYIWGHTVHTDKMDDVTLLNFIICHYLERFFAEALAAKGYDFARQKDFLINALDDVIILEHIAGRGEPSIFNLWSKAKEQGGLGWITPERLDSYTSQSK